jgi:hypothetical protein
MCPSADAIELSLFEALAEAIAEFLRRRDAACVHVLASDQRYDAIVTPGGPGPNPPKWPVMASSSNVTGRDPGSRGQCSAALRGHRLPKAGPNPPKWPVMERRRSCCSWPAA